MGGVGVSMDKQTKHHPYREGCQGGDFFSYVIWDNIKSIKKLLGGWWGVGGGGGGGGVANLTHLRTVLSGFIFIVRE